jgi:hypothetical protein
MTAKTVAQVLEAMKVPGSVLINGQDMGMIADVVVRRAEVEAEVVAAYEFGLEPVEDHYLGERWSIALGLRNFVQANLDEAFPRLSVASGLEYPGTVLAAGTRRSSHATVVRFEPNDTASHPAVEFPSAIPMAAQTFEMSFGYEPETLLAVAFMGLRDPGTGELVKIGIGI